MIKIYEHYNNDNEYNFIGDIDDFMLKDVTDIKELKTNLLNDFYNYILKDKKNPLNNIIKVNNKKNISELSFIFNEHVKYVYTVSDDKKCLTCKLYNNTQLKTTKKIPYKDFKNEIKRLTDEYIKFNEQTQSELKTEYKIKMQFNRNGFYQDN